MGGYIKLDRALFDNPWISKDHDYLLVLVYLMKDATYTEQRTVFNGEDIILKPGQLITGRKKLAEKTGVEEHKVQRVLNRLESEHLIEQQKSRHGTLITLLSEASESESEQPVEQPVSNQWATNEQPVSTNKRKKERKKVIPKEDISDDISQKDEAIALWNALPAPIPKITGISPKSPREKDYRTVMKERGMEKYRLAVENIKQSPWLLGQVSNWKISFDWFVALKNFDKVLEGNYLDQPKARGEPEPSVPEYTEEDYARIAAAQGELI